MTIKEIAEIANVSIGTVDRVLNNRTGVSKATRERIEAIVEETGFHANAYARNLKLGKKVKVGVLIPIASSEYGYWELVLGGIRKAEKEYSGFGLGLCYSFFDRDKEGDFTEAFHRLQGERCSAYLVAPLPVGEVPGLRLGDLGVPVAFIDSAIPSFHPVTVIAQNPFRGGFAAGRVASLLSSGPGVFVTVQIHPDSFNSFERARGFRSYMLRDSGNTVVNIDIKNIEEIPSALDGLFSQHEDIKGIFTVNCIVNAVGAYLVENRLKERVAAVGYDLVEENRAALKNGSVDAVISQRPFFQGYTAISSLFRYTMLGEAISPVEIPIDIYFEENLTEGTE